MDGAALRRQRRVGGGARRDPAARPRITARAAHREHATQDGDRERGLLPSDEPVVAHAVSCAKQSDVILAAQAAPLLLLGAGERTGRPAARVGVVLPQPVAQRLGRDAQVGRQGGDRFLAAPREAHRLGPELRWVCGIGTPPGAPPFSDVHCGGSPAQSMLNRGAGRKAW